MVKKRKRILSVLLSLTLALSMVCVPAFAVEGNSAGTVVGGVTIPDSIGVETDESGTTYLLFDCADDMVWLRDHVLSGEDGKDADGRYYCTHNIKLTDNIDMTDAYGRNCHNDEPGNPYEPAAEGDNNGKYSGIGDPQNWYGFSGIFDGGGYTISNIDIFSNKYVGPKGLLFNLTQNATIKNVILQGTAESNRYIGGVIGRAVGSLTLENVVVSGALTLSDGNSNAMGGLVGQFGAGQSYAGGAVSIRNCAVIGSLTSNTSSNPVGGLVGHIYTGFDVTAENTYVAASLSCTGGTVAGLIGNLVSGSTVTADNCYYPSDVAGDAVGNNTEITANVVSAQYMKSEDFLTALGAGFVMGADGYPVPSMTDSAPSGGEPAAVISSFDPLEVTAKTVDYGTAQSALGLPETLTATVDGQTVSVPVTWTSAPAYSAAPGTYTFTAGVNAKDYTLAEGVSLPTVTVTVEESAAMPESTTIDGVEYLVFDSAADMVWFREHVNAGGDVGTYCTHNVILTADIDMADYNGDNWGIGKAQGSIGYSGIFDGNGHTISNLKVTGSSVGPKGLLFNLTQNVTVKNVTVTGTLDSDRYIGGVVGRALGGLTLENVVVDAALTLNNGASNAVGGLVGQFGAGQNSISGGVSIKNCAALGTYISNKSDNPVGGLVGHTYTGFDVTIENTYVAASLSCPGGTVAGLIADLSSGATATLQNCYYPSSVEGDAVGNDATITANTVSTEYMKTADFVTDLGGGFVMGENGYPVPSMTGASVENPTISAIEPLTETAKSVPYGTAESDLGLPTTLSATVDGEPAQVPVTWSSEPEYSATAAGAYTFTAKVSGYTLAEDVTLPTVTVTVRDLEAGSTLTVASYEALDHYVTKQLVPTGRAQDELSYPEVFRVTLDTDVTVDLADSITWTSADYNPAAEGVYTFTPTLPEGYVWGENVTAPSYTVKVQKPDLKIGTAEEMLAFLNSQPTGADDSAARVDQLVVLTADIDMTGLNWTAASSRYFRGTFDGCYHTITNASAITGNLGALQAEPGYLAIRNVGMIGGSVIATNVYGGDLVNCFVKANTTGDGAGGICSLNGGSVVNCYAVKTGCTGTILTGNSWGGPFVTRTNGVANGTGNSKIINCYSVFELTLAKGGSVPSIYGILGRNDDSSEVINCYVSDPANFDYPASTTLNGTVMSLEDMAAVGFAAQLGGAYVLGGADNSYLPRLFWEKADTRTETPALYPIVLNIADDAGNLTPVTVENVAVQAAAGDTVSLSATATNATFVLTGVSVTETGGTNAVAVAPAIAADGQSLTASFGMPAYGVTIQPVQKNGAIYEIDTVDDWKAFADAVNGGYTYAGETVTLEADLDFTGCADWASVGISISKAFKGTFDGQGHTIRNLTMSHQDGVTYMGLFGAVMGTATSPAAVKNLTLDNVTYQDANGSKYAGLLVGYFNAQELSGITVKNSTLDVTGACEGVGTVVGYVYAGVASKLSKVAVEDCTLRVNSTGTAALAAGGAVGYAGAISTVAFPAITMNQVTVTGLDMDVSYPTQGMIGGLVGGDVYSITYTDCTVEGALTVTPVTKGTTGNAGYSVVGGLQGKGIFYGSSTTSISVNNCHVALDITGNGTAVAGGLVGFAAANVVVSGSSFTGGIASDSYWVGGVVGYYDKNLTVNNCIVNADLSGADNVGGIAGRSASTSATNTYSGNLILGTVTATGTAGYAGGLTGYATSAAQLKYSNNAIMPESITGGADTAGLLIPTSAAIGTNEGNAVLDITTVNGSAAAPGAFPAPSGQIPAADVLKASAYAGSLGNVTDSPMTIEDGYLPYLNEKIAVPAYMDVTSPCTVTVYGDYAGGCSLIVVYGDSETGYVYYGNAMYRTSQYDADTDADDYAYAIIVAGRVEVQDVLANLTVAAAAAADATASYDVNGTGLVDINDAQAVADCYNVKADLAQYMAVYLRADVDASHQVDSKDASMILENRE